MTAKKEAVKKKEPGSKKEAHHKSRLYDSFQEEIANTYFKTSPSGRKTSKKKKASRVPWVVAGLAAVIAAAIFISKSNFDIKVRVVSGTPFVTNDASASASDGAQYFIRGGEADRSLVSRAFFVGDARAASSMSDANLLLKNTKGQGWASFVIELKKPVDFTRYNIRYAAKGGSGSEKIFPIVVDSQNRSYKVGDAALTSLSDSWRTYIVDFKPVKSDIDLTNISAVKFEFGAETAGNPPDAVVHLKDISVIKSRRIKWL